MKKKTKRKGIEGRRYKEWRKINEENTEALQSGKKNDKSKQKDEIEMKQI